MPGLPIETERLRLRRFEPGDVEELLAISRQPSVARAAPEIGADQAAVRDYIQAQNALEPFQQDACFDLAIERKADARLLGLLTLVRRAHRKAELGYALGNEAWGQGYATEGAAALVAFAFENLNLHRIQATTSSHNPDSYRVMERLDMKREAWLREAEIQDGRWVDVLIYGLLAHEWLQAESSR